MADRVVTWEGVPLCDLSRAKLEELVVELFSENQRLRAEATQASIRRVREMAADARALLRCRAEQAWWRRFFD